MSGINSFIPVCTQHATTAKWQDHDDDRGALAAYEEQSSSALRLQPDIATAADITSLQSQVHTRPQNQSFKRCPYLRPRPEFGTPPLFCGLCCRAPTSPARPVIIWQQRKQAP